MAIDHKQTTGVKRVLILTDSLALPREAPEMVAFEETWANRLRQAFGDIYFHQVSMGGATVGALVKQATKFHKLVNPDLVIVQSGIVDCAPRALTPAELRLVKKRHLVGKVLGRLVMYATPTLRKLRRIVYTKPKEFAYQATALQAAFGKDKVYWLGILPVLPAYEAKVPNITAQVAKYNRLIAQAVGPNYIDMGGFPSSGVMSDYHHLNQAGHAYVFAQVEKVVSGFSVHAGAGSTASSS